METVLLDDFLDEGIIREKSFREQVDNMDLNKYHGKKVIIKGCGNIPLNESLYIAITKNLQAQVSSLMFGEACSSVPVYKRK